MLHILIQPMLCHNLCVPVHSFFIHVHVFVCITLCYCIPLVNDRMSSIICVCLVVTSVSYLDRLCISYYNYYILTKIIFDKYHVE